MAMQFLAFSTGTGLPHVSAHAEGWLWHVVVCLCLAAAGFLMLFYPERAFRTAVKPRWLGLPLLLFGVIGTVEWLMQAFA